MPDAYSGLEDLKLYRAGECVTVLV